MVFLRQYLLEDEENELKAWKSENSESENIPFLSVLHILHIYILSTFAFWNYEIAHHQLYFGKLQMHFLMMLNSPMPWMILQYILKFVKISHLTYLFCQCSFLWLHLVWMKHSDDLEYQLFVKLLRSIWSVSGSERVLPCRCLGSPPMWRNTKYRKLEVQVARCFLGPSTLLDNIWEIAHSGGFHLWFLLVSASCWPVSWLCPPAMLYTE